jgi:acetolactate synthase regulatory subunit
VRLGIPVLILNSRRPEGTGTVITFEAPRRGVSAIAGKNDVTLIRVSSPRMLLTEGFMRALFEVFARHHTSVDVVSTSEVSVSLTVDSNEAIPALAADLAKLADVKAAFPGDQELLIKAGKPQPVDIVLNDAIPAGSKRRYVLDGSVQAIPPFKVTFLVLKDDTKTVLASYVLER